MKVNFGSVYIPPGGDTMTVRVNQMILARHFEHPMTIYVMKFVKQEVDKVFVQYAVIDDIDKELTN